MSRKSLLITWRFLLPVAGFAIGWMAKPVAEPSPDPGTDAKPLSSRSKWKLTAGGNAEAVIETGSLVVGADGIGGSSATGRPLSENEVERLGRLFQSETDPVKRRRLFSQLLEGLTLDNALKMREQVQHLHHESSEFKDFHYAWGKIGGAEAIMNGADTHKPDMVVTLAGWASADPNAALEWFNRLEPGGGKGYHNQEYLRMGMVQGLANTDANMATEFVLQRAANGDRSAGHMMQIVTGRVLQMKGPAGAAAWAGNLPEGEMRSGVMGRIAHDYARSDPAAAASWAAGMAGSENAARVVGPVAHALARENGRNAVQWLDRLDEGPARTRSYHAAFESWVSRDPQGASSYLDTMPQSAERDHGIQGLVSRQRWEEPQAAIAWANEIGDPGMRQRAVESAAHAFLRRDRASAIEWLPTSGLSQEAQQRVMRGRR